MIRIGCFVLAGVLAAYGLFRHRATGQMPPLPSPLQCELLRLERLSPPDRARWLAAFERKHRREGRIQALLVEQESGGSPMVIAQADDEGEVALPWPAPWPLELTALVAAAGTSGASPGWTETTSRHQGRHYRHLSMALPSRKGAYLLVNCWHGPPRRSWGQVGALVVAGLLAVVGLAARSAS